MNRVIVGVDGSPPSLGAVMWAAARAKELGLPLEFVHVLDDEWGGMGVEVARREEHEAARMLAATADANRVPQGIDTRILHGSTVAELAAAVGPGDLLVVGSHKTGFIRGRSFGSLSVRLAPLVAGSMLVVPDAPAVAGRHGVVLGVGPVQSQAALNVAVREAASRGHAVTLVAAASPSDRPAASAALDRAAAEVRDLDDQLVVQRRVSGRRPAEALLDASRNAVLLVLGAASTPSASTGSTTHDVLMNPVSAVWIAR